MTNLFIQALVSGITLGLLYGLLGSSLSILYGTMRVVNVAHGEFVIGGSYLALVIYQATELNPLVSVPVAFVLFFVLGVLLYHLFMPRLSKSDDPETASFLAMYGLSLIAISALVLLFDADTRSLNFTFRPIAIRFEGIFLPTSRLVVLAADVIVIAALTFFLLRTLTGKALRAIIMNRDAVQMVGIDIHRLSAAAFGIGVGIAGSTGVLMALVFPAFGPAGGIEYTLVGFTVIILGGLGNAVGALGAGLVLGIVQQVATVVLPQSLAPAVGFVVLISAVMVRSSGWYQRVRG